MSCVTDVRVLGLEKAATGQRATVAAGRAQANFGEADPDMIKLKCQRVITKSQPGGGGGGPSAASFLILPYQLTLPPRTCADMMAGHGGNTGCSNGVAGPVSIGL